MVMMIVRSKDPGKHRLHHCGSDIQVGVRVVKVHMPEQLLDRVWLKALTEQYFCSARAAITMGSRPSAYGARP